MELDKGLYLDLNGGQSQMAANAVNVTSLATFSFVSVGHY